MTYRDSFQSEEAAPVCSICIANYNGIEIIGACIDSVLNQVVDFEYEIIVHDDASTDGSVAFIRKNYPQLRLLSNTENVGFCISNNRMASAANGKYILLLNNDALLFPDALQTLHDCAAQQLLPAILGLPQFDARTRELVDMGSRTDPFFNPITNRDPNQSSIAMVSGACLWIPVELWKTIGGFPDWFESLAEDLYLCTVARLSGYLVISIPKSGFFHWMGHSLGGGGQGTTGIPLESSVRRRRLSERNKSFVMVMTLPNPVFPFIFLSHLALLITEGVVLAFLKRDWSILTGIYLAAIGSLWRERCKLLARRKSLQSKKRIGVVKFFSVVDWRPQKLVLLFKHGVPNLK